MKRFLDFHEHLPGTHKMSAKALLITAAVAASAAIALPATAVIGSVTDIGQPGFYGRLDVSNYPLPQVIYRQPRIVERVTVERPPIYLRVPPGHAKHWSKHCREYNACGEPVYFVQDDWYQREYAPRYQELHRDEHKDEHHGNQGNNRRDDNPGRGHQH